MCEVKEFATGTSSFPGASGTTTAEVVLSPLRSQIREAARQLKPLAESGMPLVVAASRSGDFERLLALLDPDVVLRTDDGSGALRIVQGAQAVATGARLNATGRAAYPAIVDGAPGFVAAEAGVPVAVLAFTVVDGRITAIDALAGPGRVAGLGPRGLRRGRDDVRQSTAARRSPPVSTRQPPIRVAAGLDDEEQLSPPAERTAPCAKGNASGRARGNRVVTFFDLSRRKAQVQDDDLEHQDRAQS